MSRKKTPAAPRTFSEEDVIDIDGHTEACTPRARPKSPSEPRTPTKGRPSLSKNQSSLESPLVTPKLDRNKLKYRPSVSVEEPKAEVVDPDKYRAADIYTSSGFTQKVLQESADAVREGDPRFRWPAVEADEDEQLLRRFDMEAMYGPSVGLSREERWKRASAMGLSPPSEVMAALQRNPKSVMSVFDQRLNPEGSSPRR